MYSAIGSLAFTALLGGVFSGNFVAATSIPLLDLQHPTYDVWQFANGSWLENIGVRSNGQLLVTFLSQPDLYQLDPAKIRQPALVYKFPTLSTYAVTELCEDIFGVIGGNFSTSSETNYPGSYSVWKVDMRNFKGAIDGTIITPATVSKITDIPEGGLLNGMTRLGHSGDVLIADSVNGQVWKLNTQTGAYTVVQKDPIMNPVPGPFPIGINGVHILNGYLYFTNTSKVVCQGLITDDFILDAAGNAYLAQLDENTIRMINRQNTTFAIVAGYSNSSLVATPTAVEFGRTRLYENHIYITTGGGSVSPVKPPYPEGAKVVGIELSSYVAVPKKAGTGLECSRSREGFCDLFRQTILPQRINGLYERFI